MKIINTVKGLVIVFAALAVAAAGAHGAAQGGLANGALAALFDQAVSATGDSYFFVRSNIVARGGEAVPFLTQQVASTNLHARVVARAMLCWIAEPETNRQRASLLASILVDASRSHLPMFLSVQQAAASGLSLHIEGPDNRAADPLREDAAVPFLLEVVVKGAQTESRVMLADLEGYDLWARCLAAGLAAGRSGADIVPVMVEQLKGEAAEIRSSAAIALGRTRSLAAVEPLLEALSDEQPLVREAAYGALRKITGQCFLKDNKKVFWRGEDIDDSVRKEFKDWWQQNKARLLNSQEVQK